MTIGSDRMEYLGRATNIQLKREIKGTNTLTFEMPSKFFDSEKGDFVKNEFCDYIYNECKIKLHYLDEWFEFYVKKITETKQYKSIKYSYECEDSFIDELSRTGYEIVFDEELYNNVEEIGTFMNTTLEDSVWDYRADLNTGDFTEFTKERFYKIPLSQFGGSITVYPITLDVAGENFNEESDYYKKVLEEDGSFDREIESTLENPFTKDKRALQLGDDLSREKEIFWDPYYKDNGFKLLDDSKMVTLEGDYIYVPYSDLSFIYGSLFTSSYKAVEEPAYYGAYGETIQKKYALQPASQNPMDLIQIMFFNDGDEIRVDETGSIINNDCHYVIKIHQWNALLESQQKDKETLIHWESADVPKGVDWTTKYKIANDNGTYYTTGVKVNTRTIDDFTWYPIYYEDYLTMVNKDVEVYDARNLSITNRTEYNLNSGYYTTIYNNKAEEYKDEYSVEETKDLIEKETAKDYRVQSHEETRIIVPTLARNLVSNSSNITDENGWEARVQNDQGEYNTGSYANLLEISAKSTTEAGEDSGTTEDESVSDFYLELLSPNIVKGNDMDLEGTVSSDWALNFGLSSSDYIIEKDKVYAIRIQTGKWVTIDYNITYRNQETLKSDNEKEKTTTSEKEEKEQNNITITQKQTEHATEEIITKYKKSLEEYNKFLISCELPTYNEDDEEPETTVKTKVAELITSHDAAIEEEYLKWGNYYIDSDLNYLMWRYYNENEKDIPENKAGTYTQSIKEISYQDWEDSTIFKNQEFVKSFGVDLDKILIGQGSIDVAGNYTIAGTNENDDKDTYISFADIFDVMKNEGEQLVFVPTEEGGTTNKDESPLINTLYYQKEKGTWTWSKEKTADISVPDNAFLLFKAKANITNPFIGIRVDSAPMTVTVSDATYTKYAETDYSGIKIEVHSENEEDEQEYLVDNAAVKVYKLDNDTFSDEFLENVGWKLEEKTNSSSSTTVSGFTNGGTAVAKGVDISYCQTDVDWDKVKASGEVDFVILRAGYGSESSQVDKMFESHYSGATGVGIPVVGIYWYSYATTKEGAEAEADVCLATIKGKSGLKFIAYDVEEQNNVGSSTFQTISEAFFAKITAAGYTPMVYSYTSALKQLPSDFLNKYYVWAAHFAVSSIESDGLPHYEIWQYSSTGSVRGIDGAVDLNYMYKDFINGTSTNITTSTDSSNSDVSASSATEAIALTNDAAADDMITIDGDTITENNSSTTEKTTQKEGIFVSEEQGKIDWTNLDTSSIQFVILNAGGGNNVDSQFEVNYSALKTKKIPVGTFWTLSATTVDDAATEVAKYIETIKDKKFEYPIYIFTEAKINTAVYEKVFTALREAGYYAGLMSSPLILQEINDTIKKAEAICVVNKGNDVSYEGDYGMWIYDDSGTVLGDSVKYLSAHCYVDYPTTIKNEKLNGYTEDNSNNNGNTTNANDYAKRNSTNNDYTLKDGYILGGASPVWTGSSVSDLPLFFNAVLPKSNDTCSMGYALFVNDYYYGCFWLEKPQTSSDDGSEDNDNSEDETKTDDETSENETREKEEEVSKE